MARLAAGRHPQNPVPEAAAERGEGLVLRPDAPPAVQQRGRRDPAREVRRQRNSQKGSEPNYATTRLEMTP